MKTMHAAADYITRRDLEEILDQRFNSFAITFGRQLVAEITSMFRQELDMKLTATKNELRAEFRQEIRTAIAENNVLIKHDTENLLAEQSLELTNAFSEMIEPMHTKDAELERRVKALEDKS